MIDSVEIYRQADRMVEKHGTRNPETIAKELGIMIIESDDFTDLLGMYTVRWHHRIMLLNRMMEYYLRLMVIGHELGHDARHRQLAMAEGMKEFTLFNTKDKTEYEANAFAAHLLLENDAVYELAREGFTTSQIASKLNTHPDLLLIKVQEMNRLGYDFKLPVEPDSCFFKKIRCDNNETQ